MEINLKIPPKVIVTQEFLLFQKSVEFSLYRPIQAWQWMNQTRSIPDDIDWVRSDVAESWRRCLEEYHLPLGREKSFYLKNKTIKLDKRIESINTFIQLLSSNFHIFLKEAEAILVLTCPKGQLLSQIGEQPFKNTFIEEHCKVNSNWQESIVGNNGIGSTIHLKRPVAFQGMEHYISAFHPFTTLGYPLLDENGEILAVLGLVSKHQESMHSLFAFLHLICVLVNTNLPLSQPNKVSLKITHKKPLNPSKKISKSAIPYQLQQLVNKAVKLQKHKISLLITGESGVGKDHFVRLIHEAGPREDKPLVAINCASIPRELIESELFGYVSGSFTGAKSGGKAGKFMLANQGILFLDEIGDMSIDLQSTLLRVLENSEFTPVGGSKSVKVDVQIIAATNVNLLVAVESGKFRRDLYYRLNGIKINLPALRDCIDKKYIIQHILQREMQDMNDNEPDPICISPNVIKLFESHYWPGNIRQLINVIRATLYTAMDSFITEKDLPEDFLGEIESSAVQNLKQQSIDPERNVAMSLAEWEIHGVKIALHESEGNISMAAKKLGITRTTLYKKIERFDLKKPAMLI